jgi:copper chaperone NosL
MTTRVLMVLALAVSVACGVRADGPPEIQVDRTACSHCGMLISEPVYAAAYRSPGSGPRVFDDIRCLLRAAQKEPRAEAIRYWFHDAATAAWIGGGDAVFVGSPTLRTPMGGGLIAYRDRTAAREGAARHQGRVIDSVGELLRSSDVGGSRASGQAR